MIGLPHIPGPVGAITADGYPPELVLPYDYVRRSVPTQSARIASITKLTDALDRCRTPFETLQAIRRGMTEAYGAKTWIMLSTRGLSDGDYRVVQLLHDHEEDDADDATHDHNTKHCDPWLHQDLPLHHGGVIGAIIRDPHPQIVNDVDWSADPFFHDTLAGCTSLIAIPMTSETLPMTWVLILKRFPERFTTSELEESVLRATFVGSILQSKALARDLARAHEQIEQDARQVGELQRALLPEPLPRIAGLEIAASYQPSGHAGGDLYDFFPLDTDRWCILLADASGHGLAAAVVIAMVQSILHAHPPDITGPADLLAHANRHLCRKGISGFVTAFLGVYEPATRRLTYACAGHPAPLVKSSFAAGADGGSVSRLDAVLTCPLGIEEGDAIAEATTHIRRGDTILLYTDGITEARDTRDEMFREQRLDRAFRERRDRPRALIDRLETRLNVFRQGRPAQDDQTLVAIAGV